MFSLPGVRWKQLNNDEDDARIWRHLRFHDQAAEFWRQLAERLKDHPAIVAYNPLNEPHPEKAFGFHGPSTTGFEEWAAKAKGTAADVNSLNHTIVAAIRESDPTTPIILDGGFYASPAGFRGIEPVIVDP